jgi:hypothetical protein
MASSKSRAARSKRTKDELISEMEALEARSKSAEVFDPTSAALAKEHVGKTREAVRGLSVDAIVSSGAKFGLEVQRTVAGLTEQAVQRAEELSKLQAAIDVETAELERLYSIDVAAASIAALIDEHQQKKDALEKVIVTTRAAWDEEIRAHNKLVIQHNSDLEVQRQREQQEYTYRTNQARARAEEEFKYTLAISERNQKEREAQAEKEIVSRRAALAAQEAELAQFKARVDGLDAEIKKAADTAVAIATNSLKRELTAQHTLQTKDYEAALGLERQRNAALNESNAKLATEVEKLHAQLQAAKQQVTDITIKALESASGQQALQNVRDLVKENGPTRNGTKS